MERDEFERGVERVSREIGRSLNDADRALDDRVRREAEDKPYTLNGRPSGKPFNRDEYEYLCCMVSRDRITESYRHKVTGKIAWVVRKEGEQ